jgi:hypothetical protein
MKTSDCHEKPGTGDTQIDKTGRGGQNAKRIQSCMNTAWIAGVICFLRFGAGF